MWEDDVYMHHQPVSKSLQNKLRNERHNTLDGFRAQLQINDELRTIIADIRAAVHLEFRRDTHARNLSTEQIRNENAKLVVYIKTHGHADFVAAMNRARQPATRSLENVNDLVSRHPDLEEVLFTSVAVLTAVRL